MLPAAKTLTLAPPAGGIGSRFLHGVGTFLFGSTLHGIKSSGFTVYTDRNRSPARCSLLRSLLTPLACLHARASPGKNALLPDTTAPFTSATEPVDFAVLCQLFPPRRPSMVFLFISLSVSSSLPPPGRLPSRSWLQLVIRSHVSMFWFFHRGLSPHLQRAHAGRTHVIAADGRNAGAFPPPLNSSVKAVE
jgi:hypothetical protein